jgi:extracellular factor (EF) 3-hydroxypalmitic acid methyl ester biosynthesis protein
MLDHIYRRLDIASTAPEPSSLRGQIYSYNLQRAATRAVCFRASLLTKLIDEYAAGDSKPIRIFSLACGHLREAESSIALRSGRIVEFLAVDQDAESIDHVSRQFKALPITALQASVADLLKGRIKVSDFTFVYAAGLFDYLTDALAAKLVQKLFQSVKPGGKLLVANFKPGGFDDGYMEAFMDWWLIYRDEAALRKLCKAIPSELLASVSIFSDPTDSIAFTVLQKA